MLVVTGGAGFIGSNLVKAFNEKGEENIIVVDDLTDGTKFKNLMDCTLLDYWDKDDFLNRVQQNHSSLKSITAVLHQGACSTTTEWDGRYMMHNNYEYSKILLHFCLQKKIPFIYASSAAIYGASQEFQENLSCEKPLNVYGYSKYQFDQYVRRLGFNQSSQIVGLRYFNVFGPRESHKGSMASVVYHFNQQILNNGKVRLFQGTDGFGDGEQRRDFIFVEDVVKINDWFLKHPQHSGIFNVGTGKSRTFNDVARAVIAWHEQGDIEYIAFPKELKGRYQSFTEADISSLRAVGYTDQFMSVEEGVHHYLNWLNEVPSPARGKE